MDQMTVQYAMELRKKAYAQLKAKEKEIRLFGIEVWSGSRSNGGAR